VMQSARCQGEDAGVLREHEEAFPRPIQSSHQVWPIFNQ
jgi:hypothetical protein